MTHLETPNKIALFLLIVIMTLQSSPSVACILKMADYIENINELVARTDRIAIATAGKTYFENRKYRNAEGNWVIASNPQISRIDFQAIEVLKGEFAKEFSLPRVREYCGEYTILYVRKDIVFTAGKTNLLMLDAPTDVGYLEIKPEYDMWSLVVKNAIKNPSNQIKFSYKEWLNNMERAFVGVVESCDLPSFEIVTVIKGMFEKPSLMVADELHKISAEIFNRDGCVLGKEILILLSKVGVRYDIYYKYIDEFNNADAFPLEFIGWPTDDDFDANGYNNWKQLLF